MEPLTLVIRPYKHKQVASVAGRFHHAFVAAMVVLTQWPDVNLPLRYVTGFRSIGRLEETGIMRQMYTEAWLN